MTGTRVTLAALLLGAMSISAACYPRTVTDITLSPNGAKVSYFKHRLPGILLPETGVVECDRAEDGTLTNCKNLVVVFRKP